MKASSTPVKCTYCGKTMFNGKWVEIRKGNETGGVVVCNDHPEETIRKAFGGEDESNQIK